MTRHDDSLPAQGRITAIFTKRPAPGAVKTRLTPPFSAEEASALALAMLDDAAALHAAHERPYHTELAVTPDEALPWFAERYPGVPLARQRGADLGERLAHWFEERCGPERTVVAIGADCPLLGAALVTRAHELLEEGADAVFAPDGGGGYALVGLRHARHELFTAVPMSTPDMLARTLDLAEERRLFVELLPQQLDVDTEEDLLALSRALNTFLESGGRKDEFPRRTHAFLRELLTGSCA